MKILFFDWKSFAKEHVVNALEELGHIVDRVEYRYDEDNTSEYEDKIMQLLSYEYYDIAFSLNYYSNIARACHKYKIPYISWIYDSPLVQVWNKSAFYPENTIFLFDDSLCRELRKHGVERAYYMPLAADTDYIENTEFSLEEIEKFSSKVSFVGRFYDTDDEIGAEIKKRKMLFLSGYTEAAIQAQIEIQGYNFLEEMMEPKDIQKYIKKIPVKEGEDETFASAGMIFANYYMAKETTKRERRKLIAAVAEKFPLDVYTTSDISMIPKARNKGPVDYYIEMPIVFKHSKINLNFTLRAIKTGIPLRALDIMAAGGFLLTNYQEDMLKHFEPGVDFAYYLSEEDLLEKIAYYLEHEEERKQIAKNGFEKMKKNHSYKMTVEKMLKIALEGDK